MDTRAFSIACGLALLLLQSAGWADASDDLPYKSWQPTSAFRQPPERVPVAEQSPHLRGDRFERRALELRADVGLAHKLCSQAVDRCDNGVGLALSASGLVRPSPFFAWGVQLSHTTFGESLAVDGFSLDVFDRATAASLMGRVLPFDHGGADPYIEFGAGGGVFEERGAFVDAVEGERSRINASRVAPLLLASAGLDVHVNSSVKVGGRFTWTHWLLSSYDRCNGVAFGACTLPSYRHFDVENAIWSWQLGITVLFGGAH